MENDDPVGGGGGTSATRDDEGGEGESPNYATQRAQWAIWSLITYFRISSWFSLLISLNRSPIPHLSLPF